jgi:hypothetical protein
MLDPSPQEGEQDELCSKTIRFDFSCKLSVHQPGHRPMGGHQDDSACALFSTLAADAAKAGKSAGVVLAASLQSAHLGMRATPG